MSDTFLYEERIREVSRTQALTMGVAASGIAFAMHQTADDTLSLALIPILVAVLSWAVSFLCGIFNSHAKQAALGMNVGIVEERAGQNRAGVIDDFRADFRRYNTKSRRLYTAQLVFLLIGALLYVGGHVWGMAEKSAKGTSLCVTISF